MTPPSAAPMSRRTAARARPHSGRALNQSPTISPRNLHFFTQDTVSVLTRPVIAAWRFAHSLDHLIGGYKEGWIRRDFEPEFIVGSATCLSRLRCRRWHRSRSLTLWDRRGMQTHFGDVRLPPNGLPSPLGRSRRQTRTLEANHRIKMIVAVTERTTATTPSSSNAMPKARNHPQYCIVWDLGVQILDTAHGHFPRQDTEVTQRRNLRCQSRRS